MKKILVSLSIIGAVAAIAIGGTVAYFTDTETSAGNTFTAGILDLTVDNTCYYNKLADGDPNCPTVVDSEDTTQVDESIVTSWEPTDLGAKHKFFYFTDVKPGDFGEDTISLHVDNNDAWVRLVIRDVTDLDNSCNEPEMSAESLCLLNNDGELRESLVFAMWLDQGATPGFGPVRNESNENGELVPDLGEGDNIQNYEEPTLIDKGTIDPSSPSSGISEIWALPTPLLAGQTAYFGVKWNLPTSVGNEVQTDSMSATMELQVVQTRNNPGPNPTF
ncbi:MAG: TasA family protein [Patescibacteria group bacterium]